MNDKKYLLIIAKGMLMGTADIIPGISGGTVALITGIYEKLINSIKALSVKKIFALILILFKSKKTKRYQQFIRDFKNLNLDFLLFLLFGIVLAIAVASMIIPSLLRHFPSQMNGLFFGLILVSSYVPFAKIGKINLKKSVIILFGVVIAYLLTSFLPQATSNNPLYIFLCGAIAICAMILPGISGSFILKAMGQYELILSQLHQTMLLDFHAAITMTVFICGIMFGLVIFTRIISFLLSNYHNVTLSLLTGLMLGALNAVWPFGMHNNNFFAALFIIIGAIISIFFITKNKYETSDNL